MSITLNQLIDQVRHELLAPRRAETPEAMYPFLFVEEIELEVGVTVSTQVEGKGGINIHVIELGSGVSKGNEEMPRVKIKLTPLLSKDEVQEKLKQASRTWEKIEQSVILAGTKEGDMVGEG